MKTKSLILTGCLMACIVCPAAFAQDDYPKFEFFAGYSLMKTAEYDDINLRRERWRRDLTSITGRSVVPDKSDILEKGFSTTLTRNLTPVVGLSASLRYNNGSILGKSGKIRSPDGDPYKEITYDLWYKKTKVAFLVGPHFTFRKDNRVTPFLYGLAGLSHDRLLEIDEASMAFELDDPSDSYDDCWDGECSDLMKKHNSFGVALGGGFDVSINESWAIRAIQVDYFVASHPKIIGRSDEIRNKRYDNFTLSFGVVYRFGR